MFKKFIVPLLALLVLLGSGCSDDLNTNADWKEVLVVYGLLNANDTTHYIRVNRAFLNDNQSALEIARISDSLYFDSLEVKIESFDISTGTAFFRDSYLLHKTTALPKDTGIFASEPNVLYTFTQPLNPAYMYRLTVTHKTTGKQAIAETKLVNDPILGSPSHNTQNYDIDTSRDLILTWTGGKNSKIYDLYMRFYWNEYDSATNALLDSNKFIDWPMVTGREVSQTGTIRSTVPGKNFYEFLAARLPYQVGKYRRAKKAEFLFWGADNEFNLYRNVNQPSVGIVQKKPEYTNISDGNFGLFASRNFLLISKYNTGGGPGGTDIVFAPRTLTNLQTYSIMRPLKFRP